MNSEWQSFAVGLAETAGEIMRQNFSLEAQPTWKECNSPVTATDLEINKLVIEAVSQKFPNHVVIGEEESLGNAEEAEWAWVCDPLDGTVPFSHGYPMFTFSLGLAHYGESVLGVLYEPMMDRMFVASKGKGATLNGKPTSVRSFDSLDRSVIDLEIVVRDLLDDDVRIALRDQGAKVVSFYSGAFAAALVACGQLGAVLYGHKSPWDACAMDIIINEAGGKVTDLQGNKIIYNKPINGFIACADGLHEPLLNTVADYYIPANIVY